MSGCTLDSVSVSEWPAKKYVPSFPTQVSSVISFSAYQYDFRNENNVSVLLYPVKKHLASETRAVHRTDGAISSPHLGFGIQRKPRRKVWEAPTRMDNIRMTSNKVCDDSQRRRGDAAIQNDQQKSGKLLSRDPTARRTNSVFIICFSLWKWYALVNVRAEARLAYSHFFAGVIHHPTHASSRRELHPLFFWSYFSI